MFDSLLRYSKAIAAAVVVLLAQMAMVWQDEAISLDELSLLKAAALAVVVALGVAASPKNLD
jgi:hypothetical protein